MDAIFWIQDQWKTSIPMHKKTNEEIYNKMERYNL